MTLAEKIIELRRIIITLNDEHRNAKLALLKNFPDSEPLLDVIVVNLHKILERMHEHLSVMANHLD